jgi:hypothetical protein
VKSDAIRLTIPGERDYFGVAHLVLGGLASRHELTIEHFEDLLLALDGLLDRTRADAVTLAVGVDGDEIQADIGPFAAGTVREELERAASDNGIGLRRLLETVVDGFAVREENGGDWVRLTKTARSGAAG